MTRYSTVTHISTLADALSEHLNLGELRALTTLIGQRAAGQPKGELVAKLLEFMEGDGLRVAWERLDATSRAAVSEVVHAALPTFLAERFRVKYKRDPVWVSLVHWKGDAGPALLRLFFYNYTMPDDLKQRLKSFVPPPTPLSLHTLDQLPEHFDRHFPPWRVKAGEAASEPVPLTVRESERPAQRELQALLRLVDAGKIGVSAATHRATAASLSTIAAALEGGDFYATTGLDPDLGSEDTPGAMRAFAWPLLLQAGGLAQLVGTRLQLSRAGRQALASPPAEVLRALWGKWLKTTLLDELSRIDLVRGQTGKGARALTALAGRREIIAASLAKVPVGRWIAVEALRRHQRAAGQTFTVTRNAWTLYIGNVEHGAMAYAGGEEMLDERYLWCVLFEYAATLGLLDVAFVDPREARVDFRNLWGTDDMSFLSRYDGLAYVRLTPFGAYCLGTALSYEAAPLAGNMGLRVLPNLEIIASGATLDASDRLALDAYAVPVSERVWKLQPARLLSAIEEGRTLAEIQQFLETRSGAALPAGVLQLLKDVGARCERLHDRGLVRLVECTEPALAALLAHDSRTRKHCQQAGDHHVVVPLASEAAFRRGLRALGYLLPSADPAAGPAPIAKMRGARAGRASLSDA